MTKRIVRIGTSGYNYKHWAGLFYPQGLSSRKWFDFYKERFNTVEINLSFYRLPKISDYEAWYKASPRSFLFFVKGSRFITHMKKMKDCGQALDRFYERALSLKEKMAGVLWQLPPFLKKDPDKLEAFMSELKRFPKMRHCFEFRHVSWFDSEIAALLEKNKAAYCRADRRDFYEYVNVPDTADFIYLRRHGEKAFSDSYTDEQIERDADIIRAWQKKKKEVFIYYNNDLRGAALHDAFRLKAVLDGGSPRIGPLTREILQHARAA